MYYEIVHDKDYAEFTSDQLDDLSAFRCRECRSYSIPEAMDPHVNFIPKRSILPSFFCSAIALARIDVVEALVELGFDRHFSFGNVLRSGEYVENYVSLFYRESLVSLWGNDGAYYFSRCETCGAGHFSLPKNDRDVGVLESDLSRAIV
jgi:hypothetical protein